MKFIVPINGFIKQYHKYVLLTDKTRILKIIPNSYSVVSVWCSGHTVLSQTTFTWLRLHYIVISLSLQAHLACNMIYSLKSEPKLIWRMVRDNIGVEQAVLYCTETRKHWYNHLFSCLLHISTAPSFVPMCYICISSKSCLWNLFYLFIAGLLLY